MLLLAECPKKMYIYKANIKGGKSSQTIGPFKLQSLHKLIEMVNVYIFRLALFLCVEFVSSGSTRPCALIQAGRAVMIVLSSEVWNRFRKSVGTRGMIHCRKVWTWEIHKDLVKMKMLCNFVNYRVAFATVKQLKKQHFILNVAQAYFI